MAQDSVILYLALQVLLFFLQYIVIEFAMKQTARYRSDFWFFYHFIPRHVKRPQCQISQYYDKFPYADSEYWSCGMTLDDKFMIQLADELNKKIGNKSDKYKAGYILKLVQSGYTYQSDYKTYGKTDQRAFPVCTSLIHVGDCEDGAMLGAGLCQLMGIDTQVIFVTGHQAYGVRVNGFGCKFKHDGKTYLWCESTSILPMGICENKKQIIGTYTPKIPQEDYIQNHTRYDAFYRYPLK